MYSVIYEDDNFLVVNKFSGVLVHKTKFDAEDNLIDEIIKDRNLNYFLAHRIDRYTSGVVLIAKNRDVLKLVQQLFNNNQIEKSYLAIISNELPAEKVRINLSVGRSKGNKLMFSNRNAKNYKHAITEVEEISGKFVSAKPLTGRTHQIRAHLSDIGCAILNDPIYSKEVFDPEFGQFLHAHKIKFVCPISNSFIEVSAPLPQKFLDKLESMNIDCSSYYE